MPRLQRKSLDKPDEVRTFPHGRAEIFVLDDNVIGRTIFEPGWHWAENVGPIAGTASCQYHHLGVVLTGTLHVRMDDGLELEIGPGSAFEIPAGHDAWVVGDEPWVTVDYAGMRNFAQPTDESGERVLTTLLFTDIVGSTALAERLGDRAWQDLLARHNAEQLREIDRYRGRYVGSTGDGALASFDGAARAVRAAAAMVRAAHDLGLAVRVGIHTGEVELVHGDVRGVAVHVAARIMALAGTNEVLVSATTYELVAGSGLRFADRGAHELKGVSGPRQVFALVEGSTG
ncbi:MAG: adenylate/guanylate cyclase domain-containing protein [Candidatus Limnocylindrales bacterium]